MRTCKRFTISVPVKPYIKRFLELNYGSPVDFNKDPKARRVFRNLLRKPSIRYDYRYPDSLLYNKPEVEIYISEDDFYRYGWELSKTNIIAFGKYFEDNAKFFMRTAVGIYSGLGLPLNISIVKFQENFGFDEDTWNYESIKKDFYRNGKKFKIDFSEIIFKKLNNLFLVNLSDQGTISQETINSYENNK